MPGCAVKKTGRGDGDGFHRQDAKNAKDGALRVNGNGGVVSFLPMSAFDVLGALAVGALDLRRTGKPPRPIDLTVSGRERVHTSHVMSPRDLRIASRPAPESPAAPDACAGGST